MGRIVGWSGDVGSFIHDFLEASWNFDCKKNRRMKNDASLRLDRGRKHGPAIWRRERELCNFVGDVVVADGFWSA